MVTEKLKRWKKKQKAKRKLYVNAKSSWHMPFNILHATKKTHKPSVFLASVQYS